MNTKICTSIEQSKELLSLGLDPSTADMWYSYYGNSKYNPTIAYKGQQWFLCQIRNSLHNDIPCWSLEALLDLMPYFITIKEKGEPDEYYHFQLNRVGSVFHSKWQASYHGLKTERGKTHTRRIHFAVGPKEESETSLDAAFEMICWLIEQGHIKVNK